MIWQSPAFRKFLCFALSLFVGGSFVCDAQVDIAADVEGRLILARNTLDYVQKSRRLPEAAWQLDHARSASLDASIAKLFASESLIKNALQTVQIFGGYGYMTEYNVERALRDAIGSTLYSGTSEMQRNIISRWLGL